MNDEAQKPFLERLRNILITIGAVIVVITDILSTIELFRIEELLHR